MAKPPANDDRLAESAVRISDADLAAYVAGGLDARRSREVEGFLACNPDVAARVMTELHRAGAGRAARREGRRPGGRQPWRVAAAALAACLVSGVAGWSVARATIADGWREDDGDAAPAYVRDALESEQATQARQAMVSQIETPVIDADEVRRELKMRAPVLPPGWRLMDAQVYPSDDGPGLNIVALAPGGRRVSLFTVKAHGLLDASPRLARRGRSAVAYWERGDRAFVLMGDNTQDALIEAARLLARIS